ncbi:MAG: hypothetical protein WCJ72_06505 [Chryseobacterium sp.]|jgi:hypothetical protein
MSKENQNTNEVPAEQKKKLKELHGEKLKSLLLPTDDENENFLEVLAIVPDRSVVGQHQKYILTDPKKAQEVLVKNCLKTHKEEVLADDGLFYAAYGLISELIPIRQGKFGKV